MQNIRPAGIPFTYFLWQNSLKVTSASSRNFRFSRLLDVNKLGSYSGTNCYNHDQRSNVFKFYSRSTGRSWLRRGSDGKLGSCTLQRKFTSLGSWHWYHRWQILHNFCHWTWTCPPGKQNENYLLGFKICWHYKRLILKHLTQFHLNLWLLLHCFHAKVSMQLIKKQTSKTTDFVLSFQTVL